MARDIFDEIDPTPDIFDTLDPYVPAPPVVPARQAPADLPDFSTYQPPARIDIHGTAPGPADHDVQPAPDLQIPFRKPMQPMESYRPPARGLTAEEFPGQRLRESADRLSTEREESIPAPVSGFGKGLVTAATAGATVPPARPGEGPYNFAGDLVGQAAIGAVPFLLGPEIGAPAAGAYQMARAANRQKQSSTFGNVTDLDAAGAQGGLGAAGAVFPAAVGRNIVVKMLSGSAFGGAQGAASAFVDQMAEKGEIDLTAPETWEATLMGAGLGAAFGAFHKPDAPARPRVRRPPEVDPLETTFERQPLSEPPEGFARPQPPDPVRPESEPRRDIFDDLEPSQPTPEAPKPAEILQAPEAPPTPEIRQPAPAPAREAYIQRLRDAGIPEEHIEAGMRHVDNAPIQDIFDQVEIRTQDPAPIEPARSAPESPEIATISRNPPELGPDPAAPIRPKPPAPKPATPEGRPVLHVGAHVASQLRGERMGVKSQTLRVHPDDVARLKLYNGQATDPVPMSPKERWQVMGRPVKIDPSAPTLSELAHRLNERMGEHKGEPLMIVGHDAPDPEYGYNADDLAAALINRPRSKDALKAEVTRARGADRMSDQAHIESIDPNWTPESEQGLRQEAPTPRNDADEEILFQTAEMAGIPETHANDPKVVEAAAKAWKEKGTESPFFRKWFGGSRVVDETGKPKTVYHGTAKAGFDEFDLYGGNYGLFGQGGYFTENPELASSYTSKKARQGEEGGPGVYPVHLRIKKPIDMDAPADIFEWQQAYPDADFTGVKTNEAAYRVMEEDLRDQGLPKWEGAEAAQDAIRSMGYDGITHMGGDRHANSDGTKHRVWIAFEPEQIKSSMGNRGTFDARSPNILHQLGGKNAAPRDDAEVGIRFQTAEGAGIPEKFGKDEKVVAAARKAWEEKGTESPFFRSWFAGSKVADEKGKPIKIYHGTAGDFKSFMGTAWGSTDPKLAEKYSAARAADGDLWGNGSRGSIMPLYMKIQRPFDADGLARIRASGRVTIPEFFESLKKQSGAPLDPAKARQLDELQTVARKATLYDGEFFEPHNFWFDSYSHLKKGADAVQNAFRLLGYDGVKLTEGGSLTYGAFDPGQVKSATGNRGTFDARDPNMLYQLGGRKAAGFEKAERRGDVFPGKYDGKPRFEFDDSRAKWTPKFEERMDAPEKVGGNMMMGKLHQVMDHQELFKNYPELRDVDVILTVDPKRDNPGGSLERHTIKEGGQSEIRMSIGIRARSKEQAREFLMHEIQHAIQYKEDHAKGGNWRTSLSQEEQARLADKNLPDDEYNRIAAKGRNAYHHLAGEIEARDTQTRSDKPYALRRKNWKLAKRILERTKEYSAGFDHQTREWKGSPEQAQVMKAHKLLEKLGFGPEMTGGEWRALRHGDMDGFSRAPYTDEDIPAEKAIIREKASNYSDGEGVKDTQGDLFKGPGHKDSEPVDFLRKLDDIRKDDPATAKAKQDGAAAAREILGGASGDVPAQGRRGADAAGRRAKNMLAIGLDADFRKQGFVDLRGKTARTPDELGALAQVFRDPRFETFRVYYVDDAGKILAHEAMTSRLPAVSAVHPGEARARSKHYAGIESRIKRLGASGFYLSHNHPSGNVKPSEADYRVTHFLANKIKGGKFLGHVIINHKKFSFFTNKELPTGQFHERFLPGHDTLDPARTPDKPHPSLGDKIMGPGDVASIGQSLKVPEDHVTLIFSGARGDVVALSSFHANELRNMKQLSGKLRNLAAAYGGTPSAYVDENGIPMSSLKELWNTGHFLDVVRKGRFKVESMYESTHGQKATDLTLGVKASDRFTHTNENPSLYQGEDIKGSFHTEGKKAVITLFKGKADFSTWMHEHAHLLRRAALKGQDEATIVKWLESEGIKVQDGEKWTVEAEERFARGFERYLRDGKAPAAELKPLFEKIKQFMREIYQTLRGTDLEGAIPEHVRFVYDALVGARKAEAGPAAAGPKQTLFQDGKQAPKDHVGPTAKTRPPRTTKTELGSAVSYDATPGDPRSGWVTKAEQLYTDAVNEAYPLEKIQRVYEETTGQKAKPEQSIKYAINRVLGSGGSANLHLVKNLKPIFQGGEVGGVKYPKLTPEEGRQVDAFLIARDSLWRYNFTKGFDNPALTREHALDLLDHHKTLPAETRARIEHAANGMVDYAKDLARRKMEAGLPDWTPDNFDKITRNPFYVPEVRDFAKVMSKPAGKAKKSLFTSVNGLIRGTFAVDVDAPVFDPVTALIHDTHQFAAETAKMAVWNKAIDMVEGNPTLKGWIKRMPKEWAPAPHEGGIAVIRPGEVHLNPEQMKFADEYKKALFTLEKAKNDDGGDENILKRQREKILQEGARGGRSVKELEELLRRVELRQKMGKQKWEEKAFETQLKFRRLPEAERNLIQDWLDEGEPTRYLVPKEIADAVNGMTPVEWAFWQKPAVAAASLFRKMQVGWNPDFTMSNTPRDAQEAFYNVGLRPSYMFKGLYHYLKRDKVYDAFLEHGGSMQGDESGFKPATDMGADIRYGDRFIKDRYSKAKDAKVWEDKKVRVLGKELDYGQLARMAEVVKKTVGVPFEMAEAIGEAGEMMSRLGVMDMALNKKKLTPAEAADMARQATLDFKRIGAKMKGANAMIPFLNARIQGTDRMLRTAINDPAGAATRAFLAAAAPTAALLAWNAQNPNYGDIPASEKEYYWILMKDQTGPTYFKIAKGFLPQLVTNPIQMGLENLIGTAKKDWWKIAAGTLKAGLPIDDVGSTLNPALRIPLEQVANYDFYFERDVVKAPGRSPAYQFDPNTAETIKTIGRALDLSPARLQHIAQGLLGGTSNNILFVMDTALGRAGLQARKDRKLEYMPFVKRVFGQTQAWKSDLAQKQRELFRERTAKEAAMKSFRTDMARADEEGDTSAAEYLDKGMIKTQDELAEVQDKLGEIEDAIEAVEALKKQLGEAHKRKE